jgi:hypothetical protein
VFAVVQQNSAVESSTQQFAEAFEATEVAVADGTRRLYLNAGVARTVLHDDVNLIPILVP